MVLHTDRLTSLSATLDWRTPEQAVRSCYKSTVGLDRLFQHQLALVVLESTDRMQPWMKLC